MKIVFEQPVVNVVELATGPKGDTGPPSTIPGPPNTLTAGTITQIPAGGQPTVSITGTAPNQTLNLGLVDGSPTAFELRGEGFPGTGSNATATNAAAVGAYYTDTLGTNGAWRWLKTSAGTGNARWKVIGGDTGWRNISADLINGWTGTLFIRRIGDVVWWGGYISSPLTSIIFHSTLYAGFSAGYTSRGIPSIAAREGNAGGLGQIIIGANAVWAGPALPASNSVRFRGSHDTTESWPTTLPGIPG